MQTLNGYREEGLVRQTIGRHTPLAPRRPDVELPIPGYSSLSSLPSELVLLSR
jgi:hypothetical protein